MPVVAFADVVTFGEVETTAYALLLVTELLACRTCVGVHAEVATSAARPAAAKAPLAYRRLAVDVCIGQGSENANVGLEQIGKKLDTGIFVRQMADVRRQTLPEMEGANRVK